MATFAEYMLADFAYALTESGRSVVIDGETVQVFAAPETTEPSQFERGNVINKKIFHLAGTLELKVPDQLVDVDGVRWRVLGHTAAGVSVCLSLQRSVG